MELAKQEVIRRHPELAYKEFRQRLHPRLKIAIFQDLVELQRFFEQELIMNL